MMKKVLFLTVCVLLASMVSLSMAEELPETRISSPWVYSLLPDGTAAITGYSEDAEDRRPLRLHCSRRCAVWFFHCAQGHPAGDH